VDAEAVGDREGDGDAGGDLNADAVADGGLLVDVPGDVTVCAAGMMAGLGPGAAEEGAAGGVSEITGADGASVKVRGAAFGTSCAAEEGPVLPLRAKLTATDAPSTAAVTPAATSGRHTARLRPVGGDGLDG
jgi:hypothetical protein